MNRVSLPRSRPAPLLILSDFCSHRDCQVKDYKVHKKICGKVLSDIYTVPTFTSPPKLTIAPTVGIRRHLDALAHDEMPCSWQVFYGDRRRSLLIIHSLAARKTFEAFRDKAINYRDMEAIGVIAAMLLKLVNGHSVTERLVMRQMTRDFGVTEREVREHTPTDQRLGAMGLCGLW